MNYRYNEIIAWVIPGLYLLLSLGIVCVFTIAQDLGMSNFKELINWLPQGLTTSFSLFFIPFFSYVLGYIINFIFSQLEYRLYDWNLIRRPSLIILQGKSPRYEVARLVMLHQKLSLNPYEVSNLNNRSANKCFIKAKQSTDLSGLETFYLKSIFSRNILGAQVMLFISLLILYFTDELCPDWFVIIGMAILIVLFYSGWRRNTKVYAKYILSKYVQE